MRFIKTVVELGFHTQPAFACSKLTIKAVEKSVKYYQR